MLRITSLLGTTFGQKGFAVVTVALLSEALAALAAQSGWIVLLDSAASSEQVLRWLQTIKQTRPRAIVLLSPLRPSAPELDWLEAGVIQAILNKPFDLREALALVQRLAD